jgi:hypothetical protein
MFTFKDEARKKAYTLSEIEDKAVFMNHSKSVLLSKVGVASIEGFVKSSSTKDCYYPVRVKLEGSNIVGGWCECASVSFYGIPCGHMLKIRNVAVRNREALAVLVRKA